MPAQEPQCSVAEGCDREVKTGRGGIRDIEFTIQFLQLLNAGDLPRSVTVRAGDVEFEARVRIDTPKEAEYFRHGGILQYVLRSLRDRA